MNIYVISYFGFPKRLDTTADKTITNVWSLEVRERWLWQVVHVYDFSGVMLYSFRS